MNTNVEVNVLTRIPRDQRGGVAAHQLDPESTNAVAGDVQSEQAAVAQLEPAIRPQQDREDQQVPQEFVQEGRVDDGVDLARRHTVERVRADHAGRIQPVVDRQAPGRSVSRPYSSWLK